MAANLQIMNAGTGSITLPLGGYAIVGGGGNGFYREKLLVAIFGFGAPCNGIAVLVGYCLAYLAAVAKQIA